MCIVSHDASLLLKNNLYEYHHTRICEIGQSAILLILFVKKFTYTYIEDLLRLFFPEWGGFGELEKGLSNRTTPSSLYLWFITFMPR